MELLFIFLFVVAAYILYLLTERGVQKQSSSTEPSGELQPHYTKKRTVMDKREIALYFELKKEFSAEYFIFPKMRIADMLDVPSGTSYYKFRNKVLPKHVDFLICSKDFEPLVAIELNGSSHHNLIQIEKDLQKNELFKDSGLPMFTVNVGEEFSQSVVDIRDYLVGNEVSVR